MNWPLFQSPYRVNLPAEVIANSDILYKYLSSNRLIRYVSRLHLASLVKTVTTASRNKRFHIANIGCGDSFVSAAILLNCPNVISVVGLDINKDALALSREVYRQNGLKDPLIHGSIYNLPFDDDEFDLVLCSEVLEHLDDVDAALQELQRVAGTYCLISVPNDFLFRLGNLVRGHYLSSLGNPASHVQHFNRRTLQKLAERHFTIHAVRAPARLWINLVATKRATLINPGRSCHY